MKEQDLFNKIASKLSKQRNITLGNMMSTQGIKYKGKVFAFYSKKKMTFRLGRDYKSDEIKYALLDPFKTKPPLKDWFVVSYNYKDKWEFLAKKALDKMREIHG
jgi:hypothetical protein